MGFFLLFSRALNGAIIYEKTQQHRQRTGKVRELLRQRGSAVAVFGVGMAGLIEMQ
jgi:hypothetical protein